MSSKDRNSSRNECREILDQIKARLSGEMQPLVQEGQVDNESPSIEPKRASTKDWKVRLKCLRRIRARSDAVELKRESIEDDWITPKEARSEVKKEYLSQSLTLAQKTRLEDLIDRGKPELAIATAMEARKNVTKVVLRRKDSDGTFSKLHVLKEKLRRNEITREDYTTMEKQIRMQQHSENDDKTTMEPKFIETDETRRLRAKILEIEKRRRAVSKELKAHSEQCAMDDLTRVRLGIEPSNDSRRSNVGNISILREYLKIYKEREKLAKTLCKN